MFIRVLDGRVGLLLAVVVAAAAGLAAAGGDDRLVEANSAPTHTAEPGAENLIKHR